MNNGSIPYIFAFALGATAGSLIAWKIAKKKYEQIAREEIASVKEVFSHRKDMYVGPEDADEEAADKKGESYADVLTTNGYANQKNIDEVEDDKGKRVKKEHRPPYVIQPEEFGEYDNYETLSLTYYKDEVLTDEYNDVIYDVEGTVGEDSLECFGENEGDEDSVYVRNERLKIDYEILRDERTYAETMRPYLNGGIEG